MLRSMATRAATAIIGFNLFNWLVEISFRHIKKNMNY